MRNVVFFEYHKSVLSNMNQNLLFRIPAAWMKKNQKFRRCSIIYDQNVTKHSNWNYQTISAEPPSLKEYNRSPIKKKPEIKSFRCQRIGN